MSELAEVIPLHTDAPSQAVKDLYEVGEIPPMGHVPARMYAWAIRRERHGEPESAPASEASDTPESIIIPPSSEASMPAGVVPHAAQASMKAKQYFIHEV